MSSLMHPTYGPQSTQLYSLSNVPGVLAHAHPLKSLVDVLAYVTPVEVPNVVTYAPPPKVPNQLNWYAVHPMSLMSSLM